MLAKPLTLIAVSAVALGAAGCERTRPAPLGETARLDCPDRQGELTRVAVAADGRSCTYRAGEASEVELRLIPVRGDPHAVLADIERELRALGDAPVAEAQSPSPEAFAEAERITAQARADAIRADEGADEGDGEAAGEPDGRGASGDRASVSVPGLHIDAHEDGANVRVGPVHINANRQGATMRAAREVRLKGEALSRERRGFRASLVITGDQAGGPYRFVGYEAGGPKAGPLTVAVIRSTAGHDDSLQSAAEKLVRRNGGV